MTELKNKVSKSLNLNCKGRLQKNYVESVVYFATLATCSSQRICSRTLICHVDYVDRNAIFAGKFDEVAENVVQNIDNRGAVYLQSTLQSTCSLHCSLHVVDIMQFVVDRTFKILKICNYTFVQPNEGDCSACNEKIDILSRF